ncbi:hypothetical protein CHS0354_017611 [Potamilus streckersoni]|uniref:Uncharacterized protein n=1 Tax=Potamilus streckersoni TaxID=2493646 RepID=A0AAE0RP41_9BIVA|nr:hypothetical protein CHS0354_017611 [Potamilus streckersoni]
MTRLRNSKTQRRSTQDLSSVDFRTDINWWTNNMNRGVRPRNYDLRNRIVSKLLPPSHFTPPSNAISTPEATAPPYSQEKIQVPSTSLLLEAADTFTTPPVTIHTPLSTLETIPTSSTGTTPTSRLTTAFQSLFDHGSTALSPPASNLGPVNQCPIDLTPPTFEGLSQLHEPTPISPVLVTPKRSLFMANLLNITPVIETITFWVQPLTLKTPEHYSRSVNSFGNCWRIKKRMKDKYNESCH